MIRAAARRAAPPVALVGVVLVAVAALAVLTGASLERAIALALYAVGSFMAIVGFALGSRSLFRTAHDAERDATGGISAVWETTGAAAVLIVIGLALLAVGIAVDPNARLI